MGNSKFLQRATFLDPSFKKRGLQEETTAAIIKGLDKYISKVKKQKQVKEIRAARKEKPLSVYGMISLTRRKKLKAGLIELRFYTDTKIIGITDDPLVWWKTQRVRPPKNT